MMDLYYNWLAGPLDLQTFIPALVPLVLFGVLTITMPQRVRGVRKLALAAAGFAIGVFGFWMVMGAHPPSDAITSQLNTCAKATLENIVKEDGITTLGHVRFARALCANRPDPTTL